MITKSTMRRFNPCILLLAIMCNSSFIIAASTGDELTLKDAGRLIENKIEIYISKSEYERIKLNDGTKKTLRKPVALINGDSLLSEDIHTRGNTTLHLRRKSFSFSLESKATFHNRDRKVSMKKFNAISLSMDKSYIRNSLAFGLMEEIQLFGLFYSFCELRINDHSEGIYMIIERPQDWAMKKKNSPLVIRRGYDHRIDKLKVGKEVVKAEAKAYKNHYQNIYKSLGKYKGEELYTTLSQWMDLEMYMRWLAFNFFVRNGDYTDEVYFCIDPKEKKYKIIPWDYDDIFAAVPHEGIEGKKKEIGDKLIFSSEDLLDQTIVKDPYLYHLYLTELHNVLESLNQKTLKTIFEETYKDLFPYYSNQQIIEMSQYDYYKKANFETLEKDLRILFNQLLMSRIS